MAHAYERCEFDPAADEHATKLTLPPRSHRSCAHLPLRRVAYVVTIVAASVLLFAVLEDGHSLNFESSLVETIETAEELGSFNRTYAGRTAAAAWSAWGSCSKACGGGEQTRACENGVISKGKQQNCTGSATRACHIKPCAVHGGWPVARSKWLVMSNTAGH